MENYESVKIRVENREKCEEIKKLDVENKNVGFCLTLWAFLNIIKSSVFWNVLYMAETQS